MTSSSASVSNRYNAPSPTTGINTPASSGPRIDPVYRTSELNPFAAASRSAGTTRGTADPIAAMIAP